MNPLLGTARAFRRRILAERNQIEAERRLPESLARELAGAGFFRMTLPEAYGGLDLDPISALKVYEELARADASVSWCVWNGNTHWTTAQLAPNVARTIHADPDVIIANSTRASGRAEVVEGGYRVTGRWAFVSGCELAAWMILFCVVHENGGPRLTSSGVPETQFMLFPAADCEILDTWTAGGLRGTGSHDVVLHELFVPQSYGSSWTDPVVLPGARYRVPAMSRVLPGLGAMALGIARNAIEALIELAVEKVPARTTQRLCEDRGAQSRLTEAEALVRSGPPAAVRCGGAAVANGSGRERYDNEDKIRSSLGHLARRFQRGPGGRSRLHHRGCDLALHDLSDRACIPRRDAITQHIGVHPRILESTGRVLFGLEPDTPLF